MYNARGLKTERIKTTEMTRSGMSTVKPLCESTELNGSNSSSSSSSSSTSSTINTANTTINIVLVATSSRSSA